MINIPIQRCVKDKLPGYRWGGKGVGKCYTYQPGNKSARKKAKAKAEKQGRAIKHSQNK